MTKILLLGNIPPLFYPSMRVEAANYRTWQFLEPLISDGHEICLCVGDSPVPSDSLHIPVKWSKQLFWRPVPFGRSGWMRMLQKVHDDFNPDCIIAVNFYPSLYSTRIRTQKPFWMDIYGDMVTIQQAYCYRVGSNRGSPTTIKFFRQILQKGDAFSACGAPQQHMMMGELAMEGRLNRETFGYPFVQIILPGAAPLTKKPGERSKRSFLKQHGVAVDDFVVLWCGGYNAWTDVQTLFMGLEYAMEQNPKIHFVSAGANSYASDNVYHRFLEMIAQSRFCDRFHMLGWRPWAESPQLYAESDLGINIDALHAETIYGTRTRLTEMMAMDLAVITTLGSEISYLLKNREAALVFNVGDWQSLGKEIVTISKDEGKRRKILENASAFIDGELSFANSTLSVRKWANHPKLSPDKAAHDSKNQMQNMKNELRSILRMGLWKLFGKDK